MGRQRRQQNGIDLSDRERDIIRLAANGLNDKEVAEGLGISINTVRTYWRRMQVRLGKSSRLQVMAGLNSSEGPTQTNCLLEGIGLELFNALPDPTWIEYPLDNGIYINTAFQRALQVTAPRISSETFLSRFHPRERKRIESVLDLDKSQSVVTQLISDLPLFRGPVRMRVESLPASGIVKIKRVGTCTSLQEMVGPFDRSTAPLREYLGLIIVDGELRINFMDDIARVLFALDRQDANSVEDLLPSTRESLKDGINSVLGTHLAMDFLVPAALNGPETFPLRVRFVPLFEEGIAKAIIVCPIWPDKMSGKEIYRVAGLKDPIFSSDSAVTNSPI